MPEPVTRPAVIPADGPDTAAWVLEVISRNPELHDQDDWYTPYRSDLSCGTTRCVGGWANWLHGDATASILMAARHLGLDEPDTGSHCRCGEEECRCDALMDCWNDPENSTAHWLFYQATNAEAVQFLAQLAEGGL